MAGDRVDLAKYLSSKDSPRSQKPSFLTIWLSILQVLFGVNYCTGVVMSAFVGLCAAFQGKPRLCLLRIVHQRAPSEG